MIGLGFTWSAITSLTLGGAANIITESSGVAIGVVIVAFSGCMMIAWKGAVALTMMQRDIASMHRRITELETDDRIHQT